MYNHQQSFLNLGNQSNQTSNLSQTSQNQAILNTAINPALLQQNPGSSSISGNPLQNQSIFENSNYFAQDTTAKNVFQTQNGAIVQMPTQQQQYVNQSNGNFNQQRMLSNNFISYNQSNQLPQNYLRQTQQQQPVVTSSTIGKVFLYIAQGYTFGNV